MPRRRRQPSKYRCLKPLGLSVVALFILLSTRAIEAAMCSMVHSASSAAKCAIVLPPLLVAGLWLLSFVGVAAAAYRYFRDFVLGDYYADLDR